MHILGKILLGFVLLGGAFSTYYGMNTLKLRREWLADYAKKKSQFEENAKKLDQKRAELRQVRDEFARTMLDWDRYWADVNAVVVDAKVGTVRVGIGSNFGLKENETVYAFAPGAGDAMEFVGPFRVSTLREDQAALEPVEHKRSGTIRDVDAARLGSFSNKPWRIRALVPLQHLTRSHELELQLLINDELMASQKSDLVRNQQLIQIATNHLNLRLREIEGDPDAKNLKIPAQYVDGLVKVLAQEEEDRNAALAKVDNLQRRLQFAEAEFERIRTENANLVGKMPQPTTAPKDGDSVTRR